MARPKPRKGGRGGRGARGGARGTGRAAAQPVTGGTGGGPSQEVTDAVGAHAEPEADADGAGVAGVAAVLEVAEEDPAGEAESEAAPAAPEGAAGAAAADEFGGMTVSQLMEAAQAAGVPTEDAYAALNSADQRATLGALIRARTPSDDLDEADLGQLLAAALAQGVSQAEAYEALNADDQKAALRAMVRVARRADGLDGLDVSQLMAAADRAGVAKEAAFAALSEPDQKAALRRLVRDKGVVSDSDGPRPAGSVGLETESSMLDQLDVELERAQNAATAAQAQTHIQSASMMRLRMRQAGGSDKRKATVGTGAALTDTQGEVARALEENDPKRLKKALDGTDLQLDKGGSRTMEELAAAARQPGQQGARAAAYRPLSSVPLVAPPDAGYSGMRPVVDLERVTVANLLLPRWFLKDPDKMLSDKLKPRPKAGLEAAPPEEALLNFTSPENWLEATSTLALYAAKTVPPLMGPVQQQAHLHYCLGLKADMITYGAGDDLELFQLYVNFDEQFRRYLVDATEELTFQDQAIELRREELELPRQRLQLRRQKELREQLAIATAKANSAAAKVAQQSPGGKRGRRKAEPGEGEVGLRPRSDGRLEKMAKDFFGPAVSFQYLKKTVNGDAKGVCVHWNQRGCSRDPGTCPHSHHCMKCGRVGCKMSTCKATPTTPVMQLADKEPKAAKSVDKSD
eukprot:COSAG03_NODE_458_length_7748_cov_23.402406_1_plen_689_part_00